MTGRQMVAWAARLLPLLLFLGPSRADPTTTPEPSTYDNYLEDLSLIGKEVNCTEEEKECYKFDRVLNTDGKCYMAAHHRSCNTSEFYYLVFDREKISEGHYEVECRPSVKCASPNEEMMAYDKTCYHMDKIRDVICDHNRGLTFSRNIFGEGECRCVHEHCPPRPSVTQPTEEGRCRLPDLMQATYPMWNDRLRYDPLPCTEEEHECYKQGKVRYGEDGKCYTPNERGPCAEGDVYLPDSVSFDELAELDGVCARPECAEGEVRMQTHGVCMRRSDVETKVCPPYGVVVDVFGNAGCIYGAVGPQLPQVRRDELCSRDDSFKPSSEGARVRSGLHATAVVVFFSIAAQKLSGHFCV